jgi:hypothetical protein
VNKVLQIFDQSPSFRVNIRIALLKNDLFQRIVGMLSRQIGRGVQLQTRLMTAPALHLGPATQEELSNISDVSEFDGMHVIL